MQKAVADVASIDASLILTAVWPLHRRRLRRSFSKRDPNRAACWSGHKHQKFMSGPACDYTVGVFDILGKQSVVMALSAT